MATYFKYLFIEDSLLNNPEYFTPIINLRNKLFIHNNSNLLLMRYVFNSKGSYFYDDPHHAYIIINNSIENRRDSITIRYDEFLSNCKWNSSKTKKRGHVKGRSLLHRHILNTIGVKIDGVAVHHIGHTFDNRVHALLPMKFSSHTRLHANEGDIKRIDILKFSSNHWISLNRFLNNISLRDSEANILIQNYIVHESIAQNSNQLHSFLIGR